MSNRSRRGGGALARAASALTDDIDDEDEVILADDPAPEITVVEDEPDPEPEPEPDYSHEDEPDPEPVAPAPTRDDAITALQRQLAELQGRTERAEAVAAIEDEYSTVVAGLRGAKHQADTAEAALADAITKNDGKRAASAQRALAEIAVDLAEFERAEADLRPKVRQAREGKLPTSAPAAPADPFEAHISTMTPASQEWCRKNRADLTKDGRDRVAVAAHTLAVARNLAPDTPEYFKFLNAQMGYEAAPVTKVTKTAGKPMTAAPAGGRTSSRGGVTEVKLSRAEIDTARALGMSTKDYAANKAKIIENSKGNGDGLRYSQHTGHSARR